MSEPVPPVGVMHDGLSWCNAGLDPNRNDEDADDSTPFLELRDVYGAVLAEIRLSRESDCAYVGKVSGAHETHLSNDLLQIKHKIYGAAVEFQMRCAGILLAQVAQGFERLQFVLRRLSAIAIAITPDDVREEKS